MKTCKIEWMSKIILVVTLSIVLGIAWTSAGAAEKWPTKPIRLICSASAGGVLDTMSRGVAPYLSANLGVPVVVENMPGAGTRIANQYVFDAKPDGYTFLFTNNSELTVGEIVHAPRYKTEEFTYIDTYFVEGPALVVKAGSPYSDVKKLIAGSKYGRVLPFTGPLDGKSSRNEADGRSLPGRRPDYCRHSRRPYRCRIHRARDRICHAQTKEADLYRPGVP